LDIPDADVHPSEEPIVDTKERVDAGRSFVAGGPLEVGVGGSLPLFGEFDVVHSIKFHKISNY